MFWLGRFCDFLDFVFFVFIFSKPINYLNQQIFFKCWFDMLDASALGTVSKIRMHSYEKSLHTNSYESPYECLYESFDSVYSIFASKLVSKKTPCSYLFNP